MTTKNQKRNRGAAINQRPASLPKQREVSALSTEHQKLVDTSELSKFVEARRARHVVRTQKKAGTRPKPSTTLVCAGTAPNPDYRASLLDKIAELVDENQFGRSEMCFQFAKLLEFALKKLGFPAQARSGSVTYPNNGSPFSWDHGWVELGDVIIDGNVDSTTENSEVPRSIQLQPYWGPKASAPADRTFPALTRDLPNSFADDQEIKRWRDELLSWMQEQGLLE